LDPTAWEAPVSRGDDRIVVTGDGANLAATASRTACVDTFGPEAILETPNGTRGAVPGDERLRRVRWPVRLSGRPMRSDGVSRFASSNSSCADSVTRRRVRRARLWNYTTDGISAKKPMWLSVRCDHLLVRLPIMRRSAGQAARRDTRPCEVASGRLGGQGNTRCLGRKRCTDDGLTRRSCARRRARVLPGEPGLSLDSLWPRVGPRARFCITGPSAAGGLRHHRPAASDKTLCRRGTSVPGLYGYHGFFRC